eukprot:2541600-Pyramimonas_sp.AAC.1
MKFWVLMRLSEELLVSFVKPPLIILSPPPLAARDLRAALRGAKRFRNGPRHSWGSRAPPRYRAPGSRRPGRRGRPPRAASAGPPGD